MKAKNAVLFKVEHDAYLAYLKDDGETYGFQRVEIPGNIEEMMELAAAQPFDAYWVHSSTDIMPGSDWCFYDESLYDLHLTMTEDKNGRLMSSYGWKLPSGGQKAVTINFPHYGRWAKGARPLWGSLAKPKQMLMVISYLEDALGVPLRSSPSSTGWSLVKSLHGKEVVETAQKGLAQMHFTGAAAFDLVESRVPCADELKKMFLIKLDKNSAWISGATSEFYGIGQPFNTRQYDDKAVGVWRVRIDTLADAPFPIVTRTGERWLMGPIVRLLRNQRYEVQVLEGNVFPEKMMYLSKWAKKLWSARQSFKADMARWKHETSRQMAYEAIKQIAVSTVGVTAYGQFRKGEISDKERPDIKAQTQARNFEVLYHNILKAWRQDGSLPVLVNKDCVYLLVDDKDPHVSAPTYMDREDQLGGYKLEGWMEVTNDVRAILMGHQGSLQKKSALDAIGWEH